MSRIRGKNTSPELVLRCALWAAKHRYRLHAKTPVGHPDVVFPGQQIAVFIDGCQWHGCPDHYVFPRTRREFWGTKLATNVRRDHVQTVELERLGWRVLHVWEHEVFTDLEGVVARIAATIGGAIPVTVPAPRVLTVEPIPDSDDQEHRTIVDLRSLEVVRIDTRRRSTQKWPRHIGGE